MFETLAITLKNAGDVLWGWPLICFILGSGLLMTVALNFVQFRYFADAWRFVFKPEAGHGGITPMQAFLNTLSGSIGNGALIGMATAVYAGGPGAAFWVFVLGFFTMSIRFAEVWAGTSVTITAADGSLLGGPMAYIQKAPGGKVLALVYVFFCLMLTFFSGNAMQCQAIAGGLMKMTSVSAYVVAAGLFFFLLYAMLGGATRVLKVSDKIVPIKVGLFFITMLIALVYHYAALVPALKLIVQYAFMPEAVVGGVVGYSMQGAIRFSMARSLNATEAGLGTAGILYGGTGSTNPVRSGIMAMATSFVSNHMVCFTLMLLMVASGAWQSGLLGVGMTIAAYETVYGAFGGWLVTILSALFGLGVLVTYAYIGRECWVFLTGGRYMMLYNLIYCGMAVLGSVAEVAVIWNSIDLAVAGLVGINLYALLLMLPAMRKAVTAYKKV